VLHQETEKVTSKLLARQLEMNNSFAQLKDLPVENAEPAKETPLKHLKEMRVGHPTLY
jgi:hypothetical protein